MTRQTILILLLFQTSYCYSMETEVCLFYYSVELLMLMCCRRGGATHVALALLFPPVLLGFQFPIDGCCVCCLDDDVIIVR